MQAKHRAQENSPRQIRKSTHRKQHYSQDGNWNPVPFADPDMEFVFAKIGDIGKKLGRIVLQHLPGNNPAHVRPEAAITRRVRIAFLIRILVMDSMCCDPEDRPAFECQSGADRQSVFHPFRRLVASVREQSMIAHADAQTNGNPPQQNCEREGLPTEQKQCCDSADMKDGDKGGRDPRDRLCKCTVLL